MIDGAKIWGSRIFMWPEEGGGPFRLYILPHISLQLKKACDVKLVSEL
jgi:hypothetical protein